MLMLLLTILIYHIFASYDSNIAIISFPKCNKFLIFLMLYNLIFLKDYFAPVNVVELIVKQGRWPLQINACGLRLSEITGIDCLF